MMMVVALMVVMRARCCATRMPRACGKSPAPEPAAEAPAADEAADAQSETSAAGQSAAAGPGSRRCSVAPSGASFTAVMPARRRASGSTVEPADEDGPPRGPTPLSWSWKDVKTINVSVLWRCWLGSRKGIRPVESSVVRCSWRGYLSGARCNQSIQSINVKFVGRRYTTRPGAPTVISGKHDHKVHS